MEKNIPTEQPPESISEILAKPDCTLELILDHDSFIEELRYCNESLLNLYCSAVICSFTLERVIDMLKYIIEEPPLDSNDKRMYKFPFVVAEAFKTESIALVSFLFIRPSPKSPAKAEATDENEEPKEDATQESTNTDAISSKSDEYPALERLLSFVKTSSEVNPVLAGYFAKTLLALMNSRKNELLAYLFNHEVHIRNLLKHCYNQSIAEVVTRVLALEKEADKDEYGKQREQFISDIFEIAANATSAEQIVNTIKLLASLAQASKSTVSFTNKASISTIYKLAISENGSVLREALGYLMNIVKMKVDPSSVQGNNPPSLIGQLQQRLNFLCNFYRNGVVKNASDLLKQGEIDCDSIIAIGIEHLPEFKRRLEDNKQAKEIEGQFGERALACGQEKLAIVQWLQTLLRLKDVELADAFDRLELPAFLLNLLNVYSMNSNLHLAIYNIFHNALNSEMNEFIEIVEFCF
eukprot:TRINITY_DN861_c0_g3_i1.p1 TRINITY_DN861_c0_g3~~TRINITY_DN861_c0_g3_i1.p1  ORF type:complete len:468 (+),score=95.70 TRINITY_DN861_c0_g3_i1:1327-2730(+)